MNVKFRRIIALVLSIFMLVTVGATLTGCGEKSFTVTFDAGEKEGEATLAEGYDESYLVQTVTSASQLKPPKFISKDKYHNSWDKVISRINSNTRVSALWVTKSFTVKFDPNAIDVEYCQDKNCTQCPKECVVTSILDVNLPQHWTRQGYDLDKTWNGVKEKGIEIPSGENPVVTLKANWIPKEFKISFVDEDGQTKLADDKTIKYDEKIGETFIPPAKGDKEFACWLKKDSATIVSSETVYKYLSDIVLCAVWLQDGEFLISYADAGDVNNNVITYKKSDENIYLNNPSRKGFEFLSWEGEGIEKNDQGYYIPAGSEGHLSVTAKWKAKTYTIQFNGAGGTVSSSTKQFTYGQPVGELPTAEKYGCTFLNWQTVSGMNIDEDFVWVIDDSSIQLVAKYSRYLYTIKYNLEYPLYEGTKYHTLVQSKFNKSADELERLGFIKSDDEAYVYYKYDVSVGMDLAQDAFLPKFTPLDTQEYYFSAWKYRKGSKKVTIKIGTSVIINSINFPNAEEDGIIELLAAVGAYWTPGYV